MADVRKNLATPGQQKQTVCKDAQPVVASASKQSSVFVTLPVRGGTGYIWVLRSSGSLPLISSGSVSANRGFAMPGSPAWQWFEFRVPFPAGKTDENGNQPTVHRDIVFDLRRPWENAASTAPAETRCFTPFVYP